MLDLDDIIKRLHDRNLSEVARQINVTPAYISAMVRGDKTNPSYDMIKKLSDYLTKNP